jgi:hypothetical protein
MNDQNQESTEKQSEPTPATTPTAAGAGPISKVLGYAGFGVGVILMIAFIPLSKDHTINFIVGAVVGVIGGGLGSWLGSLIDKSGQ